MYLSEKLSQTPGEERDIKDHTEVEILLESVQKQVEEIVNEVETTIVRDLKSHAPFRTRCTTLTVAFLLWRRQTSRPRRRLSS